jgi:hypothetical protein
MPKTHTAIGKHRTIMAEARQRKKEKEAKNRNLLLAIGLQGMSSQQNRLIFSTPADEMAPCMTVAKLAVIIEYSQEELRDLHGFTANV